MTRIFRVFLFAIALLQFSGCDSAPERAVYDSVADQLLQSWPHLVVASKLDNRWFTENSVESVISDGTVSQGTAPPWLRPDQATLIKRLFERNREVGVIGWSPRNRRIQLLAGNYLAKPRGDKEVADMCFSAEAMPAIGISTHRGKSFRPYFSFSNIAFSDDGRYAIVKIAYACAPLSGAFEEIMILRRDGRNWALDGGTKLWVS